MAAPRQRFRVRIVIQLHTISSFKHRMNVFVKICTKNMFICMSNVLRRIQSVDIEIPSFFFFPNPWLDHKKPKFKLPRWYFQVFRARTPPDAIQLVARLLEYTPSARISPLQACAHPFFNELRESNQKLPNGRDLPPLFNFTEAGM